MKLELHERLSDELRGDLLTVMEGDECEWISIVRKPLPVRLSSSDNYMFTDISTTSKQKYQLHRNSLVL